MSKPLRILQIVPSISLVYGGPSQMVLGLSSALAAQGVEVTVLTTDSNGDIGQPPLDVPLDKPVEQDGYQVRYFHCSPFRRYKFSIDLLRWLWRYAPDYDLAHIHALFSPVSTAAATIARHRKLPYIMRPLGTLDPADLRKKRRLKQIYAALLERPNLAGAAGIHFTSAQEAKISERFGTHPPDFVIPLGVHPPQPPRIKASPYIPPLARGGRGVRGETERVMTHQGKARPELGIPDDRPLVLFMSRIDPKKGLNLLIPALEMLLVEGLNFHFVLAGTNPQDPDYQKQIQEQVKASPLASRTTITGFVTGELKAALLQDADLFVLSSYYENFGIAVAEAMVAGTPVVISDQVHIWEEVKGAEAGWVCPCEVEALTEVLREALQDVGEQKRRGANAQDYALKHYSWDAIALAMIQTYRQILDVKR
ncbi:MAG: glycosyltransferase [Coleofasciculus sp. Co-bin14]|nr:glycosyltransferase [Coleofasciculus sp. Co-bin14]